MMRLKRTNSDDKDFQNLVVELDQDLAARNGSDHAYYAQFNKIDAIKHVVVAYKNDLPVGCGAIKHFEPKVMEVKRMFVPADKRGQGFASLVLTELENWAKELSSEKCVLETGYQNPEAIALYKKSGYSQIPNYGQYIGIKSSICFEKVL